MSEAGRHALNACGLRPNRQEAAAVGRGDLFVIILLDSFWLLARWQCKHITLARLWRLERTALRARNPAGGQRYTCLVLHKLGIWKEMEGRVLDVSRPDSDSASCNKHFRPRGYGR